MAKRILAGALATGLLLSFLLFFLSHDHRPILFESLESKTRSGGPVFNRVRWFPGWNRDIWMMQQSHQGLNDAFHQWDRLAIVVDKSTFPRTARFYQFESGNLSWNPQAKDLLLPTSGLLCERKTPSFREIAQAFPSPP